MTTEPSIEQRIQRQAELDRRHGELTRLATRNFCAQCNGVLVVAWLGGGYELACGQDRTHIGTKSWKEQPREMEKEAQQMVIDKLGTEKGAELVPYARQAALTEAEAKKVLVALWPKAPSAEIVKAALICRDYGLNPLMKHIFLVPFNEGKANESWVVILSIHATRLLARRAAERQKIGYSYVDDTPRVMTEEEQKRRFGEVDKANIQAITKLEDSRGNIAPGYGNWPKDKGVYGADKGNAPQKMAFIRSERDALDRLFPGELPALEVAEAQYVEAPVMVNGKTGEIVDSPQPVAFGAAGVNPPAQPAKPNGPGITLEAILEKAVDYNWDKAKLQAQVKSKGYDLDNLSPEQAQKVYAWLAGKGNL